MCPPPSPHVQALGPPESFAGPVWLPRPDTLVGPASGIPLLARLRAFVGSLGQDHGRTVQAHGHGVPHAVHGIPAIDERTVALAYRAGFVRSRAGRPVATRRGAALGADVVEDWHATFAALLDAGVLRSGLPGPSAAPPAHALVDAEAAGLLVGLLAAGAPTSAQTLVDAVWQRAGTGRGDGPSTARRGGTQGHAVREAVGALLCVLAEVGALTRSGTTQAPGAGRVRSGTPAEGRELALTPLGVAGVHRVATAHGVDVPTFGAFRFADACGLLTAMGQLQPHEADAEIAAWLAERGPPEAVRELVAAMEQVSHDLELLAAGFQVLGAVPLAVGRAALAPYSDDVRLGPFVTAWRQLGGQGGPPPAAAVVLERAAELHPDARIACSARATAGQLRAGLIS